MAYTERSDDDAALSVEHAPSRTRRWLLVCAVVLIPVTIGAVATVALYVTRATPAQPVSNAPVSTGPDTLVPVSNGPDTLVRDGSVLIIQPRSTDRVGIPVGQVIEIVLQTGPGQTVSSANLAILASIATPPCHIFTMCGIPGVQAWTFRAAEPGTTALTITFGATLVKVCQPDSSVCVTKPPSQSILIKPVTVSGPPGSR